MRGVACMNKLFGRTIFFQGILLFEPQLFTIVINFKIKFQINNLQHGYNFQSSKKIECNFYLVINIVIIIYL